MQPRFLARTHYQVDELAYLRIIAKSCTTYNRSEYPERVAARLVEETKKQQIPLNHAAARYAVDLARAVNLINNNLVWTDLAQLLNCITEGEEDQLGLSLTLPERLFFFRVFLISDGAALLYIAQEFTKATRLPEKKNGWTEFANAMSISIYSQYLESTTDTESRTRLRQILEKRRATPYTGKSGPHQSYIHLHALYRMRLLDKKDAKHREYCLLPSTEIRKQPLLKLLQYVPDIRALERAVISRQWAEIAANVFSAQFPPISVDQAITTPEMFLEEVRPAYERVIATGLQFCPITILIEWSQIKRLSSGRPMLSFQEAMVLLETMRKRYPHQIRFHVDRAGNPAFVRIDRNIAA